jgi:MFS family permease
MAPIGLAFAVLNTLNGSTTELGLVLAARAIPNAAFVLLGGVIADRLPRHTVMVTSNIASMATQGTVAALLLTGNARVWQLIVLSALNGTSAAFFFPASQGIVPQTVPEAMIQQANALLRLALNAANVLGAALGGALVAVAGPGWAIAIDAASFGVAALFTSMLSLPEIVRERAPNIVRELAEGWNAFRSRAWLWSIVAQFSILNAVFVGAFQVLGPVQANAHYDGARTWGLILGAEAAGLICGGLVMLRARPHRRSHSRCWRRRRRPQPSPQRPSSPAAAWRSSPSAGTRRCSSRSPSTCSRASTPTTRSGRSASCLSAWP